MPAKFSIALSLSRFVLISEWGENLIKISIEWKVEKERESEKLTSILAAINSTNDSYED
jgi:hypothetical protein